jgi:chromate transporter
MMHDEVVTRRRWLDDQRFLDLIGATSLIPGPNSTEMAIYLGRLRAGWAGFIAAGVCFVAPATLMVMALAWAYMHYGSTPQATWLLYGIKPVIIAIVLQALWSLVPKAIKTPVTAVAGLAALALYFLGVHELLLILAGGLAVMLIANFRRLKNPALLGLLLPTAWTGIPLADSPPFSLTVLFLTFLKIGAVLYGSGYVLLAFLRSDFVTRLGWLTDQQLIDAIAVGQVTPGPLFTSATFIGYILGGVPGGLLATLGIFLPSFIFVALSYPFIPRLRNSPWASSFLDGVIAASLGLMAAVTWQLGRASLIDLPTALIALAALVLLFRFRLNSTWLILGGGAAGFLFGMFVD